MIVVLVALLAIAAGATTYVLGRNHDDRARDDRERSLGFGVRPTPLWTLDTARVVDAPGEVLRSFPTLDSGLNGSGVLVDSSTHLIAAVGRPREYGGADITEDVTVVGIDRAVARWIGNARWAL